MRSWSVILAAVVFVVLLALLGGALATSAQSGVQPVGSLSWRGTACPCGWYDPGLFAADLGRRHRPGRAAARGRSR